MLRERKWVIAAGLLAVVGAAGDSVPRRPIKEAYGPHDRAHFLDNATVEFVRPGLTIKVLSAAIASDGTISATFSIADPQTLPLDLAGITTPGPVSLSFLAGYIPNGQEQYVSYITRAASGAAVATTNQPAADSGGTTTQTAAGQYSYTFKTKATAFDPTVTHTIGVYGSRNLTAFSLGTNYASTTFNFVPNGSPVVTTRDVVRDASCNRCHDQLSFHGGSRRGIALCVMCHTPQNVDPDTGNTLDMKIMAHKIHMGSQLPSVIAGKPYQFIGFQNAVSDFSKVVDPADARRCVVCHDQATKAAQATAYLTRPTRLACGSCHDDVNFATGANHAAGAQPDDSRCSTCHIPQGASDFDVSIIGAHVVPAESSLLSGLVAKIASVTHGTSGSNPVVTFTLKDNKGNGVPPASLGSLSLTMAGPTTDYGYTSFGSDTAGTPGYVTESATKASCTPDGTCVYTFTHAVPAAATGTYAIGLEARRTETILTGTPKQQTVQYGAANPVSYFSVDGSTVASRRQVVAINNCNQCHVSLSEHGTLRNNSEYCVMCHNPSNTDVTVRVAATNAADKAAPPQGINFNMLVHRIHFGPNVVAGGGKPYIVVGFGGSHNDFSGTLYAPFSPTGSAGDTRNCSMCHVNGSEQNLPLGLNPVIDPQGPIQPAVQAVSAACRGCHVSIPEASHMLANTSALGESCTVCHSSGAAYAVDSVHAQY